MPLRKTSGPAVRAIREALGIKHGQFAIDCGITPGYLSNIEKGKKQPSPSVTATLATRLGVPIDAITYSEIPLAPASQIEPPTAPIPASATPYLPTTTATQPTDWLALAANAISAAELVEIGQRAKAAGAPEATIRHLQRMWRWMSQDEAAEAPQLVGVGA